MSTLHISNSIPWDGTTPQNTSFKDQIRLLFLAEADDLLQVLSPPTSNAEFRTPRDW
jgi:hypothetical protein